MCPSAFRDSSPPGPGGRGRGSNLHQNLPSGGDVREKFIKIGPGVWISTHQQTDKQTNKQTFLRSFLYL